MSPKDQVIVSIRSDVKVAIQRPLYKYNPTSSPIRTSTPASTDGAIHPPFKNTSIFSQMIILSKISNYWVKLLRVETNALLPFTHGETEQFIRYWMEIALENALFNSTGISTERVINQRVEVK